MCEDTWIGTKASISADLYLAGQLLPGETVSFKPTTLPEAQAILKTQWEELDRAIPPCRDAVP
jgi:allophanate hydrolase subunit 2